MLLKFLTTFLRFYGNITAFTIIENQTELLVFLHPSGIIFLEQCPEKPGQVRKLPLEIVLMINLK
jgi:hypothetical protein